MRGMPLTAIGLVVLGTLNGIVWVSLLGAALAIGSLYLTFGG